MVSGVNGGRESSAFQHLRDEQSAIGDAAGSSMTTVDQADMRALVSHKTVVRHGAASL